MWNLFRKFNISRELDNAYDTLFDFRNHIEQYHMVKLEAKIQLLYYIKSELLKSDNKSEEIAIKDKWLVCDIEEAIGHYQVVLEQAKDLLEHIPEWSK